MAKDASQGVLDAPLDLVATFDRLTVCSAQPTSIGEITTYGLASVALDSGDFTIAANDTTGRKVTVAAQTGVAVTESGTPTHVVIDDGTEFAITTCTGPDLTDGSTVNVPAFAVRMPEPV